LLEAQRSLVHTSGVTRAALLLGTDEATLRRDLRRADQVDTSDTPTTA
jgi:DNA-binding protein Fis